MDLYIANYVCDPVLEQMASDLDKALEKTPATTGWLHAIPVVVLGSVITTVKVILLAIENLALGILNLIGATFSQQFSYKKSKQFLKQGAQGLVWIIFSPILAPMKMILEIYRRHSKRFEEKSGISEEPEGI